MLAFDPAFNPAAPIQPDANSEFDRSQQDGHGVEQQHGVAPEVLLLQRALRDSFGRMEDNACL